jgi:hypothetical protein
MSSIAIVVIASALLLIALECRAVELPCEFSFDRVHGYSCRVVNFNNTDNGAYITEATGNHLFSADKNFRNRTNESVVRATMWNATVLYLPGNLTEIFPNLRVLVVKKCGLLKLTRTSELNGMRKIYFGFNAIARIPVNYFWHFCRLETLSLFGNQIADIPKMAFRDLISLKRLTLADNRLSYLDPQLFDNCSDLELIDLDRNSIEIIDDELFSNRSKLTRIYLRGNKIKSIGNDFLATLPSLQLAMFQKNKCINESFPDVPENSLLSPIEHIQSVFRDACSPILPTTTTTPRPTTQPPRKKPKHERQRVYYFDECKWHTPKNHRYF